MKNSLYTTLVAGTLAAATLGPAGDATAVPADSSPGTASAAPASPASVGSTISKLASKGYRVIVNRVGTASPDQCTVSQVRPGHTYTRRDHGVPGAGDDIVTTVISRTVYVDTTC
jgi:hypothetical protein